MALADIVKRIEADAAAEAAEIITQAEAEAQRILETARAESARDSEMTLRAAEREARSGADTIRATARLAARDRDLTARRELIDETLEAVRARIAALPAAEYVELIAEHVAAQAIDGQRVLVAESDAGRLAGALEVAVERHAAEIGRTLHLEYPAESAPTSEGVLLESERVRTEVSPASIVASMRDELAHRAAALLFPGGDEG